MAANRVVAVTCLFMGKLHVVALPWHLGLDCTSATLKAPLAAIRGVHNHMHHGSNHRRRGRCNNDESYCGLSHFLQVTMILIPDTHNHIGF